MSRFRNSTRVPGRRRSVHRRSAGVLVTAVAAVAALAGGTTAAVASGGLNGVAGGIGTLGSGVAGATGGLTEQLTGALARATAPAAPAEAAAPTVSPADGTTDVAPRTPVRVSVGSGRLHAVALTPDAPTGNAPAGKALAGKAPAGKAVAGTLAKDGRSWTATGPLAFGTGYHLSGTWTRDDGTVVPVGGRFGTLAPENKVTAGVNIADGATVGVGAPVILQFDRNLSDDAKARVERALTVKTSKKAEGAWAWLPDAQEGSRVHYRTKSYWPAHSTVSVTAPLRGLDLGDGSWATDDVSTSFTVGRSQIVKADTNSHGMVVVRDGKRSASYNASYGKESDPNRVTRSGTHVVMSKQQKVLMSNPAYGYVNQPEFWAVRMSNNGEFIHANPASAAAQGSSNVTHGCINLSVDDARAYFSTALFGDPVEVTGSSVALSAADGDIYDWAIPWNEWRSMSALAKR
ncbi:L,D-transpeptidase [Pseudonocardia phyllosphaerae]|uniref:L,D-transpeptidase n=1 Tax=Pseudonocardia phyllosphaerae TaxID=3390502 RepID=UPI00397C54D1